jgi:hypothetical protein
VVAIEGCFSLKASSAAQLCACAILARAAVRLSGKQIAAMMINAHLRVFMLSSPHHPPHKKHDRGDRGSNDRVGHERRPAVRNSLGACVQRGLLSCALFSLRRRERLLGECARDLRV